MARGRSAARCGFRVAKLRPHPLPQVVLTASNFGLRVAATENSDSVVVNCCERTPAHGFFALADLFRSNGLLDG